MFEKGVLCPEEPDKMIMQGTPDSVIYRSLALKIHSCEKYTGSKDGCETDEEKLKEFVNSKSLASWIIHQNIDFLNHDGDRPVFYKIK